jgi:hypothetical protein
MKSGSLGHRFGIWFWWEDTGGMKGEAGSLNYGRNRCSYPGQDRRWRFRLGHQCRGQDGSHTAQDCKGLIQAHPNCGGERFPGAPAKR